MKNSFILNAFWIALLGAFLSYSTPAFGEGTRDMVNQALDLIDQAWNPQGDQPTNDQRIELLTQALKLAQAAPAANFHGHKVKAMAAIRAAIAVLKKGDPFHTATEDIRKASDQLRDALSLAT